MKKNLFYILICIVIIGIGMFIGFNFINKTPSSGLTIPIYNCSTIGYDGNEYSSIYFGIEPDNAISCELKANYKCMYNVCEMSQELSGTEKHKTAKIYDGNAEKTKGGYYIINNKGKRVFGPYYEIKVIPYHYLAKKTPNEKYSYYDVSYKGDKIELIDKNKYDDVYTIVTSSDIGISYVGVIDGKYGFINSKNEFEYDSIKEANYHYDISCAIATKDNKQNLINGSSETLLDEWHEYVQTFKLNNVIYIAYVDQQKLYVGTYNNKVIPGGGIDAGEREFKLEYTGDINYKEYVSLYSDNDTYFYVRTDIDNYTYDPATKQLTKLQ